MAVCRILFSTSNCRCSLFSKKNPIIRIFCISGCFVVPSNPDKWSSTACCTVLMRHVTTHIQEPKTPKTRYYVGNHIMLLHTIHVSVERAQYFLDFIVIGFSQSCDICEPEIKIIHFHFFLFLSLRRAFRRFA